MILAALGVVHLVSSRAPTGDRQTNPEAGTAPTPGATTTPSPAAGERASSDPAIVITGISARKRRLRDRSTAVVARIAVAPRPNTRIGAVEIRVFFFDVTRNRELRPTDAQVAYDWITPERDWTDPSPKHLEATYLRPRAPRSAPERLCYGGLLVRVYSDGRLQDERSEPKRLLAALRSAQPVGTTASAPAANPAMASPAADFPAVPSATSSETTSPALFLEPPAPTASVTAPPPAPTAAASLPPQQPAAATASTAPIAKTVPGKPGFVYSIDNEKFIIDARGVPPGTEINDPYTGKPLRVP